MLQVSLNMSDVERMLAGVSQGAAERTIRSAISRTLKGARQEASRKAAKRYTAKASSISKTLKVRATGTVGVLTSKSYRMSLTSFRHKPQKRPSKATKGNPYFYSEVIRGQRKLHEHAFLSSVSGSHAFERLGKPRYPIKMLYGPSAAEMLGKPPTSTYIMAKMEERAQVNILHEVSALLGGFRS